MFYEKRIKMNKPIRKKVVLSNFRGYNENKISNNLPCDWTDYCVNFAFKNNKLVAGAGVQKFRAVDYLTGEEFDLPYLERLKEDCNMFIWRTSNKDSVYTKLVVSVGDALYSILLKKGAKWSRHEVQLLGVQQQNNAINYLYKDEDLLLMSGGQKGLLVMKEGEFWTVNNALEIIDLCTHYERVFAVVKGKRNSIWFSDSFNPLNWNVSLAEGGYVEFDGTLGQVNKIKSFKDYLYVFCDYGIYRMTAFAEQSSFNLKRLYGACGRIFDNSVAECGDKIFFASTDGVYYFDGYDIGRINIGLGKLLSNIGLKVEGAYNNNKYYLTINSGDKNSQYEILDGEPNDFNRLVVIDTLTLNVDISDGIGLKNMLTLATPNQNCIIALSNNNIVTIKENGEFFEEEPLRIWRIKDIDFGVGSNQKVIKGIEYSSTIQFWLVVTADNTIREFLLSPNENYRSLNIKAKKFSFEIKSTCNGGEISPPIITVDFLRS